MKKIVFAACLAAWCAAVSAQTSFSGNAGARLDMGFYDGAAGKTAPQLTTTGFFSGQFNFSKSLFLRSEFSVATSNLLSKSIFSQTPALFRLDEFSLVLRDRYEHTANYFTVFAGNFEPFGSDVFLQRYFGADPIASKITDSWLGTGNSTIFNSLGLGVGNVVKSEKWPVAFGVSFLFDREIYHNDDMAMLLPLRLALAYRYFTLDYMLALGVPLEVDAGNFIKIRTIYLRNGFTMLFGNNYTPFSFMFQAGVTFVSFHLRPDPGNPGLLFPSLTLIDLPSGDAMLGLPDDILFFVLEPRIKFGSNHINLTLYNLPQEAVSRFYAVRDTLGANFLYYNDSVYAGDKKFTFGANITVTLVNASLISLAMKKPLQGMHAYLSPYLETDLALGRIKFAIDIEPLQFPATAAGDLDLSASKFGEALRLKLGYSAKF